LEARIEEFPDGFPSEVSVELFMLDAPSIKQTLGIEITNIVIRTFAADVDVAQFQNTEPLPLEDDSANS